MKKDYLTSEFDYDIDKSLIAQKPLQNRSESRLLIYSRKEDKITDDYFYNLCKYIDEKTFLVVNNTKVIKARFLLNDNSKKKEILLSRQIEENDKYSIWDCIIRPGNLFKKNRKFISDKKNIEFEVMDISNTGRIMKLTKLNNKPFEEILEEEGNVPTPPYVNNPDIKLEEYQTVYAKNNIKHIPSIAAPTAGFHFDDKLIKKLNRNNINMYEITLQVGPGTFKPVKTEKISAHNLDPEFYFIEKHIAEKINHDKQAKHLCAVGTTSIRTLESASSPSGTIEKLSGFTGLYITPGYKFKIVDKIITNFHLPKTSLFILVSSFLGINLTKKIYNYAIRKKYRFYSFGDAMLIL